MHVNGDADETAPSEAFDREASTLARRWSGVGVWSIDLEAGRIRGTAQFFRIMGLPPASDSIPLDVLQALRHPDDSESALQGFHQALGDGGDACEIEYRIVRPDGDLRWVLRRGGVTRDPSGRPTRYSGADVDITDRKTIEAALDAAHRELERMNLLLDERVVERTRALEAESARRATADARRHHAQKLEAIGQLSGAIAHDFNNVLQVILGNLEIIRVGLGRIVPDPASRTVLDRASERAERAAQSAKDLIRRLLAFGRKQSLAPIEIDAVTLIAEMTGAIRSALGATIQVETSLDPDTWPVFADRSQLERALLNLVDNAKDSMRDRGRLLIETSNLSVVDASIEELAPGRYVMLRVSDTGCGIPPEHIERVFEPFFTTKDRSVASGLGLATIHGFAKQSGGHVHLESAIGVGTSVTLYLPSIDTAPAADTPGQGAAS
jgi:PAS domain S-box-containing protein